MSRFGMTGRLLVAKVDRDVDPYTHIDRLRQEVFDQAQRIEQLENEIQALKNVRIDRWTESGIWKIVRGKINEEKIGWIDTAIKGGTAALFVALLGGTGWLILMAIKGIRSG